ncbi:hypothetical protein DMN91_008754 [Ooceraea biroi]|uniref:Transposase Tc1-like domain-containing protein n=1 Tax=Ooceraea biroi TaxID=2015173 RepID=A0A3L8DD50_OOCBI|nr:hypothetical protein DMN91_008754 [Ooceraea biroi]
MGRGPSLSIEKRAAVTVLHNDGRSVRYIVDKLNIPRSTVSDASTRFQRTGCNKNKARTGRPRVTSKSEDQSLILMSKMNRKLTAPEIQSRFNENHEHQISVTTVKDRLHKAGLWSRVSTRKLLLRHGNRANRLQWAQNHKDWTIENWKRVLWTDESTEVRGFWSKTKNICPSRTFGKNAPRLYNSYS